METTKNRIILILLIFSVTLLIFNINSCNAVKSRAKNLDQEQALRMNLEERIMSLDVEVSKLKEILNKTNQDFDATKKLLADQQLLNDNLKEQLQKTKDVKEALEDNLTNSGKVSKKR
ncbi:MAG: hypothetical protein AB1755_03750 [Candidatus Omnitrophota bacterium]